ncbi:MAG: type II toxin-antitoxin system prevent-host-death family antitoxin [Pyrinomonadaceae bacterium]
MKVGVYEAKSKLSQMIEKALAGEEVVITRNGEEVVELKPIVKKPKKDWIGMWKGKITIRDSFFEPLDEETLALFEDGPIEPPIEHQMKK